MNKKEDLIIVDIGNIEDIVLAKYKIDQADPEVDDRSDLTEFITNNCTLTDVIMLNGNIKPFNLLNKFGMTFLFVSNLNDVDDIKKMLNKCKYNLNTLKEISFENMMNPNYMKDNIVLIHDSKYYNI